MNGTAYVTGAERGLGLALTRELLALGYEVFAGSYHETHPELDALGAAPAARLHVLPLDVTDKQSVDAAAAKIAGVTRRLDLLINNAGLAIDRSNSILDPFFFEDMHAVMEVNAFGPLRVTKSVIELLRRSDRGVLVNISSIAASIASLTRTRQYAYTMSKVAMNMQSKLIRNHLGPEGLTVLAVHPGVMPTLILGDPEITKNAPVTTEESAKGIVALARREWAPDDHFFVDYQGNPIPW